MKDNKNLNLIYILPNLFTASSAFLGIVSIIASSKGDYSHAILLIVLSLILDGMDGRVARLTNTASKFGVEFDSLADVIAFGAAPAMLFYFTIGQHFGKLGSLVAAIYVVLGAVRLARFNIMSGNEPTVFIGLPIPSAAIVSAFWIGIYNKYDIKGLEWFILAIMIVVALLMVSNIRYPSFKKLDFKRANFLRMLIALIIVFSLLYLYPLETATLFMSCYTLYGILRAFWVFFNRNKTPNEPVK